MTIDNRKCDRCGRDGPWDVLDINEVERTICPICLTKPKREIVGHSDLTDEIEALDEAITTLDAVWEFDAARGMRDGLGGHEYTSGSPVPLRRDLRARLAIAAGVVDLKETER